MWFALVLALFFASGTVRQLGIQLCAAERMDYIYTAAYNVTKTGGGGLSMDSDGTVYIADLGNFCVKKMVGPPGSGVITTVAGNGNETYSGDGGPAVLAGMSVYDVAVGNNGALYIADFTANRVRLVNSNGIINTVAGNGSDVFFPINGNVDGPATAVAVPGPSHLAFGFGILYISSINEHRVRKLMPDGTIRLVAGTGQQFLFGDGWFATRAVLQYPAGLAVVSDGSLLIADSFNQRVRRVAPDGIISTVAGSIRGSRGDGKLAVDTIINYPIDVEVSSDGSFYFVETDYGINNFVRRVLPNGIISTTAGAGNGGDRDYAVAARLNSPSSLAVSNDYKMYILEVTNIRFIELYKYIAQTCPFYCACAAVVPPPGVNLALQKYVTASSVYYDSNYPNGISASNLVDGRVNTFAHTMCNERNGYFQIDLNASYNLAQVVIINRMDCCQDRMRQFSVYLSNVDFGNSTSATISFTPGVIETPVELSQFVNNITYTLQLDGSRAFRYIRIVNQLNNGGCLNLAEVQAYAAANPAAQTTGAQSSACAQSTTTAAPTTAVQTTAAQTTAAQTTVAQTTAVQSTAVKTTSAQTTAAQTTGLQTTAVRTTAAQTTAAQTTAAQTTAAQTTATCSGLVYNRNVPVGSNISGTQGVNSNVDCCNLCLQNPACNLYLYFKNSTVAPTSNLCQLKTVGANFDASQTVVQGASQTQVAINYATVAARIR